MSDPKNTPQKTRAAKAPAAETARQEGAQGRTGQASDNQAPRDTVGDGEIDASDPVLQAEIATVADEVHANA